MLASELSPSYSNFSYKKKKTGFFLVSLIWLFTCSLNTIKLLIHPHRFEFLEMIWPVIFVLYLVILLDFFLSKTSFELTDGRLTVFYLDIFHKRTRIFEINKMQGLEIEQFNTKTFLFKRATTTNEQIITFFYDGKEITLGKDLQNFNAEELFEAITSVKSNPGKES